MKPASTQNTNKQTNDKQRQHTGLLGRWIESYCGDHLTAHIKYLPMRVFAYLFVFVFHVWRFSCVLLWLVRWLFRCCHYCRCRFFGYCNSRFVVVVSLIVVVAVCVLFAVGATAKQRPTVTVCCFVCRGCYVLFVVFCCSVLCCLFLCLFVAVIVCCLLFVCLFVVSLLLVSSFVRSFVCLFVCLMFVCLLLVSLLKKV